MTGGRPRVNADDDRFFDFFYPRDPIQPYGVYEKCMPARYVNTIDEIAADGAKMSWTLTPEQSSHHEALRSIVMRAMMRAVRG